MTKTKLKNYQNMIKESPIVKLRAKMGDQPSAKASVYADTFYANERDARKIKIAQTPTPGFSKTVESMKPVVKMNQYHQAEAAKRR
jgi:hypothetical protein